MPRRFLVCIAIALVCAQSSAQKPKEASPAPAAEALTRLADLKGEWHGTATWTGARSGSYPINAKYSLSGYGSAVVEDLSGDDGVVSMTSVYHLDGDLLRLTHYCGARNQPRLKSERIDNARGEYAFSFVDATNLASWDAPHVHGLELKLIDANHLRVVFLFTAAGKESRETIELER
jgi:hypothetical protein